MHLKIPPPFVFASCVGLMYLLAWVWPQSVVHLPGAAYVSLPLALLGLLVAASGVFVFWRAKTTIDPRDPARVTSFVTAGIYRLTRNPMYLGLLLLMLALGIHRGQWLGLLVSPAMLVTYLNAYQIGPEEAVLARIYGQEFESYRARVRRWV